MRIFLYTLRVLSPTVKRRGCEREACKEGSEKTVDRCSGDVPVNQNISSLCRRAVAGKMVV
ncbi:hypothetical protein TRIP_B10026 [uncultured Desulfatiglans sp.]|uniref:Uncharacterized protein n=1 Tax=Uncultured Desulfatiglans sp. TaxID=1748965 RepID=A0A653A054_UNCDX|nr:hypothetical protein TRIP_B10026 [uncultured Desulfatiglans sp.]